VRTATILAGGLLASALLGGCLGAGMPLLADIDPLPPVQAGASATPALPVTTATAEGFPPAATTGPSLRVNPTIQPYNSPTPTPQPFAEGPYIIGFSVSQRPVEVYRFGAGPVERMIVAGIHGGGEANTIALAHELMAHIFENPHVIPADTTLFILPNLNPDGEARGRGATGRLNDNGVDLNRNWPYNWQAEWPKIGCWYEIPTSAGETPASEPETVALMMFIRYHRLDALISYHSAALGIFAGGVPPFAPSESLAESMAAVSDYPYPPLHTGCLYTGNLTDWAAAQGIAAVDIELTDHTHTDFHQNLRVLEAFLNWRP